MNKSIWFFMLLWPIVLLPKSLQLVLGLSLGVMLSAFKIKKTNKIFILICMYSAVHIFSIIINALIGDYELSRIAAAMNTAIIWIGAAMLYEYHENLGEERLNPYQYVYNFSPMLEQQLLLGGLRLAHVLNTIF